MFKAIKQIVVILAALIGVVILLVAALFSIANGTNGKITSSNQVRKFLLYVPETYNPDTPTPLVISLHGFVEWPAHQMEISGWNDLADEFGFVVVYPSGTRFPLRWHASGIPGTQQDTTDDVAFIADLIDLLAAEYNIDRSRVYANGFSNGGGMSHLLACELPDRIAAIGGVAGAYFYPWENCNPSRPVPVIAFHGTADPIVPYGGGDESHTGDPFPVVPEWVETWARRNGCDLDPLALPSVGEVDGIQYQDCEQNAEVHFYTIEGDGHSWPGGGYLPAFIVGHTTRDINATEVIWDFFKDYSLLDR